MPWALTKRRRMHPEYLGVSVFWVRDFSVIWSTMLKEFTKIHLKIIKNKQINNS
jgi:hypothetical protein